MTLRPSTSAERRDEMMRLAHGRAEKATDRAVRRFLRSVMASVRESLNEPLTAAAPNLAVQFGIGEDVFTLDQAQGWWRESVDEDLLPSLRSIWQAGYSDTSTVASSSDDVAKYLATVRDRLSPHASPSLPHDAFDLARTALTEELRAGSSIPNIGRRLAAEFSWDKDEPFWEARKLDAQTQIDALLDPFGAPGSYAREHAKRSDPKVAALREISNEATNRIDSVEGEWRGRATLIARTEATAAFNAAALQAMRDESADKKVWMATPGARTRATHAAASGQEVDLDQPFMVGGYAMQHPGDPSAPAREVCSCRCTMIAGGL